MPRRLALPVKETQPLGGPKYYVATLNRAGEARVIHEAYPSGGTASSSDRPRVAEERGYEVIDRRLANGRECKDDDCDDDGAFRAFDGMCGMGDDADAYRCSVMGGGGGGEMRSALSYIDDLNECAMKRNLSDLGEMDPKGRSGSACPTEVTEDLTEFSDDLTELTVDTLGQEGRSWMYSFRSMLCASLAVPWDEQIYVG